MTIIRDELIVRSNVYFVEEQFSVLGAHLPKENEMDSSLSSKYQSENEHDLMTKAFHDAQRSPNSLFFNTITLWSIYVCIL